MIGGCQYPEEEEMSIDDFYMEAQDHMLLLGGEDQFLTTRLVFNMAGQKIYYIVGGIT
jgi:hypothetical protein